MKRLRAYYLYIALVIVYLALTFSIAPSAADLHKYHISLLKYRLTDVAVVVPYVLIWLAGFYGYHKLSLYSRRIRKSPDGRQVHRLSVGLLWLVLWPPLSSILAAITKELSRTDHALKVPLIIFNNYFNLIEPLIGFVIIGMAARGLSEIAKARPSQRAINVLAIILILLGATYGYLSYYAFRMTPHQYHMPYWLVLFTLVVPYVYMWFTGIYAAHQIYGYRQKVAGIVYRRSWTWLAYGTGAIIVLQIFVQYANSLQHLLLKLSFGAYVLVVYVVLLLLAIGYLLVARGARQLQKIEEV